MLHKSTSGPYRRPSTKSSGAAYSSDPHGVRSAAPPLHMFDSPKSARTETILFIWLSNWLRYINFVSANVSPTILMNCLVLSNMMFSIFKSLKKGKIMMIMHDNGRTLEYHSSERLGVGTGARRRARACAARRTRAARPARARGPRAGRAPRRARPARARTGRRRPPPPSPRTAAARAAHKHYHHLHCPPLSTARLWLPL